MWDVSILRECNDDANAGVEDRGVVAAVSASVIIWVVHVVQVLCLAHMCLERGVIGVGGVCEMCMYMYIYVHIIIL